MRSPVAILCLSTTLLSSALPPSTSRADEAPRPCSAPEFHRFDFWIGDWEVHAPDGRVVGMNRITSALGGCALQEQWRGKSGMSGTSLNAWDAARGVWHQTWMDSSGSVLMLDGDFHDGKMVLAGRTPLAGGKTREERITWTPVSVTEVRQLWEQSVDGGRTWTIAFDGRYLAAAAPARSGRH